MLTAAAVLAAALAGEPAHADTGPGGLSPTIVDSVSTGAAGGPVTPPPNPVGTSGDNSAGAPTAPQDNTAGSTQTTSTVGGNGGRATGGNAGPGGTAGNAFANGGNAESHSNITNTQSNRAPRGSSSGSGFGSGAGDTWGGGKGGSGGFKVVSKQPRRSSRPGARANHSSPSERVGLKVPASRLAPLGANGPRADDVAKASPLGGGLPGRHSPVPGPNSFFSFMSGPGSAGTALTMLLLAVLASSISLPRQLSRALRTRAPAWRPLAYVPPIDLPG